MVAVDPSRPFEQAIEYIAELKMAKPSANKAEIQANFELKFKPTRARSVFVGDGYALRFSEALTGSFSNTVLSLSALQIHDSRPFLVVAVRENSIDFLLANASFLKKISHSSLMLRADNVKGSFNGSDILVEYDGIARRISISCLLYLRRSRGKKI